MKHDSTWITFYFVFIKTSAFLHCVGQVGMWLSLLASTIESDCPLVGVSGHISLWLHSLPSVGEL